MNAETKTAVDAAVLKRLLTHLDDRRDVQNIELMILAGFCRNCLSKWYREAAEEQGVELDLGAAQERIYGMPYAEWKQQFQKPATAEQLEQFEAAQARQD